MIKMPHPHMVFPRYFQKHDSSEDMNTPLNREGLLDLTEEGMLEKPRVTAYPYPQAWNPRQLHVLMKMMVLTQPIELSKRMGTGRSSSGAKIVTLDKLIITLNIINIYTTVNVSRVLAKIVSSAALLFFGITSNYAESSFSQWRYILSIQMSGSRLIVEFCSHAVDTLEDIIQEAIRQNFDTLALTEHMPRDSLNDLYPEEVTGPMNNRLIQETSHT
jgi:PHP domain